MRHCCWSYPFNAIKRKCEQSVLHTWHKNSQGTILTVCIGIYIHSKICRESMVNKFSSAGLCISSCCVDEIQSATTQNLCQQYCLKEILCSDSLVKNLFTTAAVGNTDQNETTITSSSHFNGASILVF